MSPNSTSSKAPRRVIGLERSYRCVSCRSEHRSWERTASCPTCGEAFVAAVIRRAALSA